MNFVVADVTFADEVTRSGIEREGFANIWSDPILSWVGREFEMNDPTSIMPQDDQSAELPEGRRGDNEEVQGFESANVVIEESLPG